MDKFYSYCITQMQLYPYESADFLLQCVKFFCIEEFDERKSEAVADFLNSNNARILAIAIQNVLDRCCRQIG